MDLNAVRMFVAAVHAGSLSAAAGRLEVSLPTLSRRIRELEAELNVRLFERNARGVKLTDVGTRLYEHASRGIESLEDAARAVASDEAQLKGTLRLSIPQPFEPWWELIAAFQRNRWPNTPCRRGTSRSSIHRGATYPPSCGSTSISAKRTRRRFETGKRPNRRLAEMAIR